MFLVVLRRFSIKVARRIGPLHAAKAWFEEKIHAQTVFMRMLYGVEVIAWNYNTLTGLQLHLVGGFNPFEKY